MFTKHPQKSSDWTNTFSSLDSRDEQRSGTDSPYVASARYPTLLIDTSIKRLSFAVSDLIRILFTSDFLPVQLANGWWRISGCSALMFLLSFNLFAFLNDCVSNILIATADRHPVCPARGRDFVSIVTNRYLMRYRSKDYFEPKSH